MKRLLIVENEKEIRRGIRAMAERAPVPVEEILECRDGLEAFELLRQTPVDVMITDIRMPGMDGIELARRAAALPAAPLTVVVSGYDDFSYAVDLMRLGVRDYLLKPVERENIFTLLAALEEELGENSRSRQSRLAAAMQLVRSLIQGTGPQNGELRAIAKQYGDLLYRGPYVVVCGPGDGLPGAGANAPVKCLYTLKGVEGHTVYIERAKRARTLCESLGGPRADAACLGVSGVHTGIEGLRSAFGQAAARGAAFIHGATRQWEQPPPRPAQARDAREEMEQVVHLLGALNTKEAEQALGGVLLRAQNGGMEPGDFAAAMASLAVRLEEMYGGEMAAGSAAFRGVWRWRSAYEYYLDFCGWMEGLAERLREGYEDKARRKIHAALVYLREHFRGEIDMAVVSNHVSMNYTQFSCLFKQYTGEGFLDYLKNLRLAESRKLLKDTDLRIGEVSARSGFKNEKHFMKTFKAAMAVSPSEYRRNVRSGEMGP